MEPFWTLLFVGLCIGIILVFYFSPAYAARVDIPAPGPFDLSKSTQIIQESDSQTFYSGSSGTFSAFVYLNPLNRTGTHDPGVSDPIQTPCLCDRTTGDCSICAHTGYNSAFNISGIIKLEILLVPDASRQGMAMAQLVVKTEGPRLATSTADVSDALELSQSAAVAAGTAEALAKAAGTGSSGSPARAAAKAAANAAVTARAQVDAVDAAAGATASSQKYIETLSLPTIPLQKWTFITIAREGRRFDIYYNDRIVLSQKTLNMPITNPTDTSLGGITSGSTGLFGQLAISNLYNYRMSTKDVSGKYSEYADSRGRPYLNIVSNPLSLADVSGLSPTYASMFSTSFSSYIPSLNICPSGGCLNPPVIQPANPFYDWSSQYK